MNHLNIFLLMSVAVLAASGASAKDGVRSTELKRCETFSAFAEMTAAARDSGTSLADYMAFIEDDGTPLNAGYFSLVKWIYLESAETPAETKKHALRVCTAEIH